MSASLTSLRDEFAGRLLTAPEDVAPFVTDWRRKWTGRARCVVQPDDAAGVAAVVRWCARHHVPVVPQGGNTGLSGGATPDPSGDAIVLSLLRLHGVRDVDRANGTLTIEAGATLHDAQRAAESVGRLFPLSLAAEGTCTVGGVLATNAGGVAVLRYGSARDLCLGIEVVTASGELWDGLNRLRKNNTGYDLRDLFVGSEGTLGIITAAVLRLYPQPRGRAVAFVGLATVRAAVELLDRARDALDSRLTAVELMSRECLALVRRHHGLRAPLDTGADWYVLMELSDPESFESAEAALTRFLEASLETRLIEDGRVASSLRDAGELWATRENVAEAQAKEGPAIKHDIALPISRLADFVESVTPTLVRRWPGVRPVVFGHVGDGNLHYNLSPADAVSSADFLSWEAEINRYVHDEVHARGGSISAEHGLGVLRRDEIVRYRSEVDIALRRSIKHALDPHGIMNPGKVLPRPRGVIGAGAAYEV